MRNGYLCLNRVAQIEEALAVVYAQVSDEPHPLLLEQPKLDLSSSNVSTTEADHIEVAVDALGTLAIGEHGQSKYFGPSAGTEAAYSHTDDAISSHSSPIDLEPQLFRLSSQFPINLGIDGSSSLSSVIRHFPGRLKASSLCELYTEQYAWSCTPVLRDELMDEFLVPTYKILEAINDPADTPTTALHPHRCAVLFLVFALGSWVDLTQVNYWEDADKYYHLARACLTMQSIFEAPECATVQAIALLSSYSDIRGHLSSMTLHPGWTLLSLASKIAQGLGLHRDVSKWNYLDTKTVNRRQHLFWDITGSDCYFSLSMGRPPSIQKSYIDARLATDPGIADSDGQLLQGFFRWRHELVHNYCFEIIDTLLAATPPTYKDILTLDQRIREKPIPPHLNTLLVKESEGVGVEVTPKRMFESVLAGLFRSGLLLIVHRTHFSRSLQHPSKNPLLSPFAPSFVAAYRAASWVTKCLRVILSSYPDLMHRLWHPWTHALSACVILGCIVIYVPSNPIAENAFNELNAIWKLLQKIQIRATEAYNRHKESGVSSSVPAISFPSADFGEDELALFGGRTRILVTKLSTLSPDPPEPMQASSQSFVVGENMNIDVHPSLLHFLHAAPMTQLASFSSPEASFSSMQNVPGPSSVNFQPPGTSVEFPELTNGLQSQFGFPLQNSQYGDGRLWQENEYELDEDLGGIGDQWQTFLEQLNFIPE
ncbi:hypothetical protein DL96DRAFT_1707686 [Flagelloscypha sp. PMI_526]|nr:hypothetical protein DL96DRAFT_1707686 [Flagelloscypha sp. PMI_526]